MAQKKLKRGEYFKSIHFNGYVEITNVNEEDNDLEVIIYRSNDHHHDEHWNLKDTRVGFENGDYWSFSLRKGKDPNRVKEVYDKYSSEWKAQYNMILDDGVTCSQCAHNYKCKLIFGGEDSNTSCQFYPSRFLLNTNK